MSDESATSQQRRNLLFFLAHYLFLLLIFSGFASQYGFRESLAQGIWMALSYLTYPLVYLLPGYAISAGLLLSAGTRHAFLKRTGIAAALLWTSLCEFLLLVDLGILIRFGYHINGLVLNLMFTPGGFEAMGLDAATLLPATLALLLGAAANLGLAWAVWRTKIAGALSAWLFASEKRTLRRRIRTAFTGVAVAGFVLSMFLLAFADFYSMKAVLISKNAYPVVFSMRMRKTLKRLGFREPPREEALFDANPDIVGALNYPAKPIERVTPEKPLNIIWLTAESLRADLLCERVMPNAWCGVAQQGILAKQHYSGGHGTRPAMFAMFYGLYGNNWNAFLNCRRPPLLFDWLQQDGYQFLVQTSAKFTYPEFDQTIFASIPSKDMTEVTDKLPWRRDVKATDRILAFLDSWDSTSSAPFFIFEFFEGTHAPYTFDEATALTDDYEREINYATVSKADAPRIYNRQVNAANCLDRQIGRILAALEARPELAARTIVVVTGDHGEEFFEKGRLGHNSTFVEEQIRPPLAMRIPGVPHTEITHPSHHTDIIPTIAPFLGVKNPPKDYCVGESLLNPAYDRPYFIVCGWQIETFVTPDTKYILPTGAGKKYYGRNLFTIDDTPLEDDAAFLREHSRDLLEAYDEMTRFVKPAK